MGPIQLSAKSLAMGEAPMIRGLEWVMRGPTQKRPHLAKLGLASLDHFHICIYRQSYLRHHYMSTVGTICVWKGGTLVIKLG